jgi:NAD(P)-dependent dehydrogenase (short-subunit alcohol dehydrogenase family)
MALSGKKALVFGGTSGIGLASARALAAAGASVVAISRDPSKAEAIPAMGTPGGSVVQCFASISTCPITAMVVYVLEHVPMEIGT